MTADLRFAREMLDRLLRTHSAPPDCWCKPYEEKPGVWVHRDVPDEVEALPRDGPRGPSSDDA